MHRTTSRFWRCFEELPESVQTKFSSRQCTVFSRWFESLRGGKYVVVVVVSHPAPKARHWIITAYIARELAKEVEVRE